MQSREIVTFFVVLLGGGVLFSALGAAAIPIGDSSLAATMPLSLPILCICSGVIGVFSGCLMYDTESFQSTIMHIAGTPLFFVLGRGSLQPLLTLGCVFACYALLYLVGFLLYDRFTLPQEEDTPESL